LKLPRISIVTPSFKQAEYLEETILSVLNQGYPNIEYIVIDGGSSDGSVEIIRKYEKHLSYWITEPDRGQADALVKGFKRATGEIFSWLCSDDLYKPGALWVAAGAFLNIPALDVFYGDTEYVYPDGTTRRKNRVAYEYSIMRYFNLIAQPSSFFSRASYERAGGLDPSLQYAMDYDLFLRMGSEARCVNVPLVLSSYRLHSESKTVSQAEQFSAEWRSAREKALGRRVNAFDALIGCWYTGRVAWKYWTERKECKLWYDNSKYRIHAPLDSLPR